MRKPADAIAILKHLKVQNANAISSPLTWGFPAVSSILGFGHALERKLNANRDYKELKFGGLGIVCHSFTPQIYCSHSNSDAVFCLTRNPLAKDGSTPSLVEEGRCHMDISLIIELYDENFNFDHAERKKQLGDDIFLNIQDLRISGGTILPDKRMPFIIIEECLSTREEKNKLIKQNLRKLLPGFALISRSDLLAERTAELRSLNPEATALDALLEFSSLNFKPANSTPDDTHLEESKTEKNHLRKDETEWSIRTKQGWIVPIPVGYAAISAQYEPGTVLNARDNINPFQFVECIYSLGQWLSLHRINSLDTICWHYQYDEPSGIYHCVNDPKILIDQLYPKGETNE
jgi:CRISPR-associated protein Csy2